MDSGEIARVRAEEGTPYSDMAIMYRANAQSRALEGALVHAGLPYQLVGGTRFYERREVKDAIAYLQAIVNPADNVNMRRILNVPKRGLDLAPNRSSSHMPMLMRPRSGTASTISTRSTACPPAPASSSPHSGT